MTSLNSFLSKFPKTSNKIISYGTAGFRTKAIELDHVMFRMGILAVLRSRMMKAAIGVMITASHNPEDDNGVKLIDPQGEMLEITWESIATDIANVNDQHLENAINKIVNQFNIDNQVDSKVLIGRDTRRSSETFSQAVIQGVLALNGNYIDFKILTTPQLHYILLCYNSNHEYGQPSEEGYYKKLSNAFIALNGSQTEKVRNYLPSVEVDGANGVGAMQLEKLIKYLGNSLNIKQNNCGEGVLNENCGADFVKVQQKPPKSLQLQSGQRYLSFDGDADRVIYYYKNSNDNQFHMLDGDKIAVLIASYLKELLEQANLKLDLLIVQTAYANGSSTLYMENVLKIPVACVPTGVKHLHHRVQQSDIGVYFEANGHGTVVFSKQSKTVIKEAQNNNQAAKRLFNLMNLINETVGDAISDMLVVETILKARGQSEQDWDNLYTDLPNRQLKVNVADRNVITTGDAERKCLTPKGLQDAIDSHVAKFGPKSRSFVRPSGTEDVVRVYAEAETQAKADELAKQVADAVFDLAGGVGLKS